MAQANLDDCGPAGAGQSRLASLDEVEAANVALHKLATSMGDNEVQPWMKSLWMRSLRVEQIGDERETTILSLETDAMVRWVAADWGKDILRHLCSVLDPRGPIAIVSRAAMRAENSRSGRGRLLRFPLPEVDHQPPSLVAFPDFTPLRERSGPVARDLVHRLIEETLALGENVTPEIILAGYDDRLDLVENALSHVPCRESRVLLEDLINWVERRRVMSNRTGRSDYISRQNLIDFIARHPRAPDSLANGRLSVRPKGTTPRPADVLSIVSQWCGVDVADITGSQRQRAKMRARSISIHLLRRVCGLTLSRIGDIMGGRDHSSILSALERIDRDAEADAGYRRMIAIILNECDKAGVGRYAVQLATSASFQSGKTAERTPIGCENNTVFGRPVYHGQELSCSRRG